MQENNANARRRLRGGAEVCLCGGRAQTTIKGQGPFTVGTVFPKQEKNPAENMFLCRERQKQREREKGKRRKRERRTLSKKITQNKGEPLDLVRLYDGNRWM